MWAIGRLPSLMLTTVRMIALVTHAPCVVFGVGVRTGCCLFVADFLAVFCIAVFDDGCLRFRRWNMRDAIGLIILDFSILYRWLLFRYWS